jgi:hypothetical protein
VPAVSPCTPQYALRRRDQRQTAALLPISPRPSNLPGKILRQWGAGHFYMPHMVTVDRHGSVWIADVGRHQVLKFTPDGKLLMEVGTKLEPGSGPDHFCKPTQARARWARVEGCGEALWRPPRALNPQ